MDGFQIILFGRALLAAVLGFVIGWERENSGAPAGDRTFALVALASATLTNFSIQTFSSEGARVIAGIISGVGFLGAGMIMRRDSGEVQGLTTAAGLWATTSIGVIVGAGYCWLAVLLTGLMLLVLLWEDIPLVRRLGLRNTRSNNPDKRILSLEDEKANSKVSYN